MNIQNELQGVQIKYHRLAAMSTQAQHNIQRIRLQLRNYKLVPLQQSAPTNIQIPTVQRQQAIVDNQLINQMDIMSQNLLQEAGTHHVIANKIQQSSLKLYEQLNLMHQCQLTLGQGKTTANAVNVIEKAQQTIQDLEQTLTNVVKQSNKQQVGLHLTAQGIKTLQNQQPQDWTTQQYIESMKKKQKQQLLQSIIDQRPSLMPKKIIKPEYISKSYMPINQSEVPPNDLVRFGNQSYLPLNQDQNALDDPRNYIFDNSIAQIDKVDNDLNQQDLQMNSMLRTMDDRSKFTSFYSAQDNPQLFSQMPELVQKRFRQKLYAQNPVTSKKRRLNEEDGRILTQFTDRVYERQLQKREPIKIKKSNIILMDQQLQMDQIQSNFLDANTRIKIDKQQRQIRNRMTLRKKEPSLSRFSKIKYQNWYDDMMNQQYA